VDLALLVNANGLTFEAANARHAHEWTIWRDTPLPEGKYLIPGVVSHSTNVVEHPELVTQRIRQFADIVGDERVVASTDCGLGGRIYPSTACGGWGGGVLTAPPAGGAFPRLFSGKAPHSLSFASHN